MPLVRTAVRNVYGLGTPELYRDSEKEDPKAVLDGVAVAGLVGILRQLGDLAEFAAEVFHGLQEQVMVTSSRSNKLVARVQKIEAALPPLEKSVLAQRSHLHFAYTAVGMQDPIGMPVSVVNKIILYTMTCQDLSWIRMKNVMVRHACICLTDLTLVDLDLA